jgi:hypothetical protein
MAGAPPESFPRVRGWAAEDSFVFNRILDPLDAAPVMSVSVVVFRKEYTGAATECVLCGNLL